MRKLVLLALFGAMSIVLSYISIPIASGLKLTFSFLVTSSLGYMLGPLYGMLFGFVMDPIKFLIKPDGIYVFWWCLIEVFAGLIYGLFLHKKKISYKRCFLCKVAVNLFCNVILTSLFFSLLMGKEFAIANLVARLVKNIVLVPFEALIMTELLKRLEKICQ